ncbi:hypothetical protein COOONC_04196 [Cooperia oncophora]
MFVVLLKTPAHVAILINGRAVNKDSLMSLLNVCLGANIRRLTIYDPFTDYSPLADDLRIFCKSKRIKMIAGCTTPAMDLSCYRLIVHLLSADSGRGTLVEACRDLSSSYTPISVADVSSHLAKRYSLYEPEVLIQVGKHSIVVRLSSMVSTGNRDRSCTHVTLHSIRFRRMFRSLQQTGYSVREVEKHIFLSLTEPILYEVILALK